MIVSLSTINILYLLTDCFIIWASWSRWIRSLEAFEFILESETEKISFYLFSI